MFLIGASAVVRIAGITVRNGQSKAGEHGGGVFNAGSLTMERCMVTGNRAGDGTDGVTDSPGILGWGRDGGSGGGIFNSGILTLRESTISDNRSGNGGNSDDNYGGKGGRGGGIRNDNAVATIIGCTINGNVCGMGGDGCRAEDMGDSVVYFGAGSGGEGAGIANEASTVTIMNSTIAGNESGRGGGLCNVPDKGVGGCGGGILSARSSMDIAFTTIVGNLNLCGYGGGGMSLFFGSTRARNSIVSGNSSLTDAPDIFQFSNVSPLAFSGAVALGSIDGVGATGVGPIVLGSTAVLGDLSDNGGPTLTMLPVSGSVIIDAIPLHDCTDFSGQSVTTDQRGFARPAGSKCDIGAVEVW